MIEHGFLNSWTYPKMKYKGYQVKLAEYHKICEPADIFQTIGKMKLYESWEKECNVIIENLQKEA